MAPAVSGASRFRSGDLLLEAYIRLQPMGTLDPLTVKGDEIPLWKQSTMDGRYSSRMGFSSSIVSFKDESSLPKGHLDATMIEALVTE